MSKESWHSIPDFQKASPTAGEAISCPVCYDLRLELIAGPKCRHKLHPDSREEDTKLLPPKSAGWVTESNFIVFSFKPKIFDIGMSLLPTPSYCF